MALLLAWVYVTGLSLLVLLIGTVAPPSPAAQSLASFGVWLFLPLVLALGLGAGLLVGYRRDPESWIFRSRGANLAAAALCLAGTWLLSTQVLG